MLSRPAVLVSFLDTTGQPIPMIAWDGATDRVAVTETNMPLEEATIEEDASAVALAISNGQTHYLREVA